LSIFSEAGSIFTKRGRWVEDKGRLIPKCFRLNPFCGSASGIRTRTKVFVPYIWHRFFAFPSPNTSQHVNLCAHESRCSRLGRFSLKKKKIMGFWGNPHMCAGYVTLGECIKVRISRPKL